ncbi:hypothetical protein [Sphingopyxis sp. MWB1]|uniref:hypothetical protein n=1 Tax=Sphingopyxis sp. MWB1 TaxID=1537715 RepID=UPI000A5A598E|nr:hypothetical protein [Sphingopyxis sp. MWB1]
MRYFLYAYIILIPFLHALSPVPIQTIGFILLVAISPFVLLTRGIEPGVFLRQDICLFITLIWGFVAWWLYPVPIEMDRVQGGVQWLSSVVFSLIIVRKLIIISRVTIEDIGRAASLAVILLSIGIIADFYLANIEGVRLSDIIPYSVDKFPEAEVLGLQRPRGLTVEAGFNGIIFECLAPFSVYYFLKNRNLLSIVAIAMASLGGILIFSLSTIFAVAVSISLLFLIKSRSFFSLFFVAIFVPSLVYMALSNQFLFDLFGYKIADFLDIANYNVFAVGRQGSLLVGIQLFLENILGIGWGTVLQEATIPGTAIDYSLDGGSLISLWLELLVATGIIGFGFFAYVFVKNAKGLVEKRGRASDFIFVSLVAVSLHHIFVYDLWFPMIWFSLAVAQVALSRPYGPYFLSSDNRRTARPKS